MKCVICRRGVTKPGTATVTLERDGVTLVIRGVPARVCGNCGEEYIDDRETARLYELAEEVERTGVRIGVRDYLAA